MDQRNSKLTATENVIFTCYEILAEFLRIIVILTYF